MGSKTRVGLLVGLALAVAVAVPAASQARTLWSTWAIHLVWHRRHEREEP